MISREELRQLAEVECAKDCAITFYFQPRTPQDKSHRRESIEIKDMVKAALLQLEHNGNSMHAREDLARILSVSEQLQGNHSRPKAVFACGELDFWKEFDLESNLEATQLQVNSRFHLKPLAAAIFSAPRACVAVCDREMARFFSLRGEQLTEIAGFTDEVPRRGRSDGFRGYNAGHIERHVDNEVMRHFKHFADHLQGVCMQGGMGLLLIGCRPDLWPEIDPHLHPYLKQRLIGRFSVDPMAKEDEIRAAAVRVMQEFQASEQQARIREVIGEAHRNGRGSLGLRHVMASLERGEAQTLLIGNSFSAQAVECIHCGHMDTRMAPGCAVCGKPTKELNDMADKLIGIALRRGLDIVYVDDPDFERSGNIGALLRFRADQSTAGKLAG